MSIGGNGPVTRKKDGKSLFEVIGPGSGKSGKPLGVPSWFEKGEAPASPAPPRPVSAPPKTKPMTSPPPAPVLGEPILSVSGGRLRISLNQISAVVALLAIILLGVGAFLLGRWTSPNSPAGPQGRIRAPHNRSTTRLADNRPSVLPVPGPDRNGHDRRLAGMVPNDASREKGFSYLVIQGGIQSLNEAENIKRFLYSQGIDATIHRMTHTGMYMVKDMRGFRNLRSSQTRAAMGEYVAQIERLGRNYLSQGGRYDFKQSSGTGPWMITEK